MNGNDLSQLLEEEEYEISREEDETIVFSIYKNKNSNLNSNSTLTASNSNQDQGDQEKEKEKITFRMFDEKFQNSKNELEVLKEQQLTKDDYNKRQKEKGKQILQKLKYTNEENSYKPVEERLFEYQKKTLQKLEQQRKIKEEQELIELNKMPRLTDRTNKILIRKSMTQSVSPKEKGRQFSNINVAASSDLKAYYEEQKKKEEMRIKLLEEKEMKEFTGKPKINKKSRSISRKVDDLLEWKEIQEKKREQQISKKLISEQQQIQKLQSQKIICKNSQKMLSQKYGNQRIEKVEDRLLREQAKMINKNQQKQQEVFQISELEKDLKKHKKQISNTTQGNQQNMMEINEQRQFNVSQDVKQIQNITQQTCCQSNNYSLKSFQQISPISQYNQYNYNSQKQTPKNNFTFTQNTFRSSHSEQDQQINTYQQKKKKVLYESLFQKLQKMNNPNVVHGQQGIDEIASYNQYNSQQFRNDEYNIQYQVKNPIYEAIQKEYGSQRSSVHCQPFEYQDINNAYNTIQATDNNEDINTYEKYQKYHNYKIINKILDSSFIHNGNIKSQRRGSFDIKSFENESSQSQQIQNNNEQLKILYSDDLMDNQYYSQKENKQKNSNDNLKFLERNIKWLELKQQKLQKAQEQQEIEQIIICPFQPKTSNLRRSISKSKLKNIKSPNQSKQRTQTKEEGIQVDSFSIYNQRKTSGCTFKEYQLSDDEIKYVSSGNSQTTDKINLAINEINKYQSQNQNLSELNNDKCDISCLSPSLRQNNSQIDQSNFESVSFLSVGANENDLFNKANFLGPAQSLQKKLINF